MAERTVNLTTHRDGLPGRLDTVKCAVPQSLVVLRRSVLVSLATVAGLCVVGTLSAAALLHISAADLHAALALRPPASQFADEVWSKDTDKNKNPQPITLAQLARDVEPKQRGVVERAGFQRGWLSLWTRAVNSTGGGLNAEAVGLLFRDGRGANAVAALLRDAHGKHDPLSSTPDATPIAPLRLGTHGWGFHSTGGDEGFEYGFVLGNAVIDVDMLCWDDTCAPNQHVRQALERYARAIASRAG
jgi:hypothetical protein